MVSHKIRWVLDILRMRRERVLFLDSCLDAALAFLG